MPHYGTFTFLDYSGEKSTVQFYNGAITAVSLAGYLTNFGALRTAIDGITLGTIHKEKWVGDDTLLSNANPTNAFAQRELKWLVRYRGNSSQKVYTLEIPTADPTGRLLPDSDFADLDETATAAFVSAFETIARAPDDDNENVTVLSIQLVGRNL